ncbi:hypothetical protein VNO78_16918 [Psophocarpus tetragonolobus]|uniref:Uncharacterized protein n=1 Tax=Psophocarpus tetragonolobus TaxID=3891 RepID=A0AAN9SM18_PSOTE
MLVISELMRGENAPSGADKLKDLRKKFAQEQAHEIIFTTLDEDDKSSVFSESQCVLDLAVDKTFFVIYH